MATGAAVCEELLEQNTHSEPNSQTNRQTFKFSCEGPPAIVETIRCAIVGWDGSDPFRPGGFAIICCRDSG